jgi:hypothetical protein
MGAQLGGGLALRWAAFQLAQDIGEGVIRNLEANLIFPLTTAGISAGVYISLVTYSPKEVCLLNPDRTTCIGREWVEIACLAGSASATLFALWRTVLRRAPEAPPRRPEPRVIEQIVNTTRAIGESSTEGSRVIGRASAQASSASGAYFSSWWPFGRRAD